MESVVSCVCMSGELEPVVERELSMVLPNPSNAVTVVLIETVRSNTIWHFEL